VRFAAEQMHSQPRKVELRKETRRFALMCAK
jgi:hypothetical protein